MKSAFRPTSVLLCVATIVCSSNFTAYALDNYLGAAAVLKTVSDKAAAPKEPKELNETEKLKRDLKAFPQKAAGLKPAEAAQAWLALIDAFQTIPSSQRNEMGEPLRIESVLEVLPGPETWDEITKAAEARPVGTGKKAIRPLGLRLLVHTLTGNKEAQKKDMAEMETAVGTLDSNEAMRVAYGLDRLIELQSQKSGDADAIIKSLERQLAQVGSSRGFGRDLNVPDLVSVVGAEKAEKFLRHALTNAPVELKIDVGRETQQLARKLALELMPELKVAQWPLTCSLDGTTLYEAMDKRFGKPESQKTNNTVSSLLEQSSQDNRSQQEARTFYMLGLIVANRSKEAVALTKYFEKDGQFYFPHDALKSLEGAGHTQAVHDFFLEVLRANPELPFWSDYIPLAAKVGETDKMLELVRAASARDGLSKAKKRSIRRYLVSALLAADQVEEGVKELRQLMSEKSSPSTSGYDYERQGLGLSLARLGSLLKRPEWVEEGVQWTHQEIKEHEGDRNANSQSSTIVSLAEFLLELNRGPEAETLLTTALTAAAGPVDPNQYGGDDRATGDYLAGLANLYHRAGRESDVLTLLEQSPDWNAKDLLEPNEQHGHGKYRGNGVDDSIGYVTAAALHSLGRTSDARRILNALLESDAGFDPGYDLLVKIDGVKLLPRLDELFSRDQFEERPLIWKAILLQGAGKLEEAETTIRRAIAIDPSDGEQGPGRRMRAYAVLADIREKRGDKKEADLFRGAVKAIRLSETADRYYEAGLLKQAVKMYEESLLSFADAYCIQSRLALRMSELGMHEAAEEHYQRAYELMPDSFGRVESHCFGCENAFTGERAQSLAEKVFTRLAAKTPEKPQVHYLLGYLREAQGRYKEALTHFREAVKLDPDYLNAWTHIQTVGRWAQLPTADLDAVALNLIRLDPLNRHSSRSYEVSDLRALWKAMETAARMKFAKSDSVYPLPASKLAMEKKMATTPAWNRYRFDRNSDRDDTSPAKAVAQNMMINAAATLIGNEYGSFDE